MILQNLNFPIKYIYEIAKCQFSVNVIYRTTEYNFVSLEYNLLKVSRK